MMSEPKRFTVGDTVRYLWHDGWHTSVIVTDDVRNKIRRMKNGDYVCDTTPMELVKAVKAIEGLRLGIGGFIPPVKAIEGLRLGIGGFIPPVKVIEGLRLDITGAKLHEHCSSQVEHYSRLADSYETQDIARKMCVTVAEVEAWERANPKMDFIKLPQIQHRAEFFKTNCLYILNDPNVVYRISFDEAARLEVPGHGH